MQRETPGEASGESRGEGPGDSSRTRVDLPQRRADPTREDLPRRRAPEAAASGPTVPGSTVSGPTVSGSAVPGSTASGPGDDEVVPFDDGRAYERRQRRSPWRWIRRVFSLVVALVVGTPLAAGG